ncbi:MAG TPA: OST-HTH/LOTUS domain-containing protein, partial [Acidimicrobiia bacterium]|nr:OST-HTH/LOTUS domain-containing protein [Acidimicrobiia bacterium]
NLDGVDATGQDAPPPSEADDQQELDSLVTTTLGGLLRSTQGDVLASSLKRAILRKDPTFTEADYGYRAFGELLRHLETEGVLELSEGPGRGDPLVQFPATGSGGETGAFEMLHDTVRELGSSNGPVVLSGLKNQLRKRQPDFSEKKFGYGGFLQFCKAAATRGLIDLTWDESVGDYTVTAR